MTALLASIVDDMADIGLPVTFAATDPIVIECQPTALRRALTNLLDNALKYGKSASASIATTPRGVTMMITDQGPGIPETELVRVKEPFYRLEQSRSRDTGGIGLGLAIAQAIVATHGGTLVLENRPEGGLCAAVTLPC